MGVRVQDLCVLSVELSALLARAFLHVSIHPYPCIRKWVFPGRLCHFLISGGYFTVQGLISYVKFLKYKTRFKYKNLGHSPYGPWPIWAKAHMGQGPYGPGPIWARAHMGPGPLGPGPFLVGRTPHQKTHPGKKSPNCVFWVVFWKQKRCAASVRSFWRRYRAEISAMCQKTKVSVLRNIS